MKGGGLVHNLGVQANTKGPELNLRALEMIIQMGKSFKNTKLCIFFPLCFSSLYFYIHELNAMH